MLQSNTGLAQIVSASADAIRPVSYIAFPEVHNAYFFYSPDGTDRKGSLTVNAPDPGSYDFEWSLYNPSTDGWNPPFLISSGISSTVSGLEEGGYKVRVFNGIGFDTVYYAWVFIDQLSALIEKTADGKVKPFKYTCDFLVLNASVQSDVFTYYDLQTHEPLGLKNGYKFLWTSDNPGLFIPNASTVLNPNTTYLPPTKDTRYFLTVTDSAGMKVRDSVLYESIHVKADFSMQYYDRKDKKEFTDFQGTTEGEAPLIIRFTNKSENGVEFEWVFNDTIFPGALYSEVSVLEDYEPEFTYHIPADYYPYLVARSDAGCVDTLRVENPVIVQDSELKTANVFSPDNDGVNDVFKLTHRSMKNFSIRIYSRSGHLVYKADVGDMYEWEGWDGKVMNSNRDASPGVYYYIIEAQGWDSENYRKGPFRGVLYLFRRAE